MKNETRWKRNKRQQQSNDAHSDKRCIEWSQSFDNKHRTNTAKADVSVHTNCTHSDFMATIISALANLCIINHVISNNYNTTINIESGWTLTGVRATGFMEFGIILFCNETFTNPLTFKCHHPGYSVLYLLLKEKNKLHAIYSNSNQIIFTRTNKKHWRNIKFHKNLNIATLNTARTIITQHVEKNLQIKVEVSALLKKLQKTRKKISIQNTVFLKQDNDVKLTANNILNRYVITKERHNLFCCTW